MASNYCASCARPRTSRSLSIRRARTKSSASSVSKSAPMTSFPSLLRRTQRATPVARNDRRRLRFGDWTLDTASRELTRPGEAAAALGVSGYALLLAFLEHPFETLSREHLSRVLKREYMPYDRIIDVHVSQIRRALGKQADGSSFIKTLRSQGYVFIADVEACN